MSRSPAKSPTQNKGRGALSNESGRYDLARAVEPDGWETRDSEETTAPAETEVTFENPRSFITLNRSPDLPFDRSINPYRGCEHGCIYCFARPTHAWLGFSPGLDFETRLVVRKDADQVLARELRAKNYQVAPIAIGTNTDPYQPIEKKYRIMRRCLQVLAEFRHPVAIVTKGALIERDLDILAPMAQQGLVRVGVSITTLNEALSRRMEPRVPGPKRRLATIRRLSEVGIPVKIMTSPIVPGLTDHEIESLLEAGRDAGATSASWIMLRLPREVSPLWKEWLSVHEPHRVDKIMSKLRDMHGGKEYDARWGHRMRGEGVYAELIAKRFNIAAKRFGLDTASVSLRCDLFRPPQKVGDQLSFF